MKKKLSLLFIVIFIILLFVSCAKPEDPVSPTTESGLTLENLLETTGYTYDAVATDDYIYAAEDQAGFKIFDKSDNSTVVDFYNTLYENMRIIIPHEEDSLLFIYNRYGESTGILVFGISDISNPQIFPGIVGDTSGVFDMKTVKHEDGIEVIWSVNASSDKILLGGRYSYDEVNQMWTWTGGSTEFTFNYEIGKFDVVGDYFYVCSDQLGVTILERGEWEPIELGRFDTKGLPQAVKVVDNFVYVADRQNGVVIADATDKTNPVVVKELETSGYAQEVDVEGNILAVASGGGGVYAFDITDPTNPIEIGRIDDSEIGYTYNVDIHDGIIYASTRLGVAKISID